MSNPDCSKNLIPINILFMIILASLSSFILGIFFFWILQRIRIGNFQKITSEILQKAETLAKSKIDKAESAIKELQIDHQRQVDQAWQIERKKMQREHDRIQMREDKIEERLQSIDKQLSEISKKEAKLQATIVSLEEKQQKLDLKKAEAVKTLEKISGLTAQQAKETLIQSLTEDVKKEAAAIIRRTRTETEEDADRIASTIIATAIGRLAVPCVSEGTVNTVPLQSDELKGRIIGRDGRNIRAFEKATGANLFVDDTPGLVVISTYDPIRLHIAKLALTDLLQDGRIHPTRIEEAVAKAEMETEKNIKHYGEDAALRVGIVGLHPEILRLLGKLKFRLSLGQNVLDHSLEVSYLMGMMAEELGLDAQLARTIGLLHDMGKAVSHEIEGTHALIGRDFALKYGLGPDVANGIGCHHGEIEPTTIEGSLCSAADAISASRPGARMEAVEQYIKRLKNLEEIAYEFPGVEKAYALQAGRELRIMVQPDVIDDAETLNLARNITKTIEQRMRFAGKIKVSVIREMQAVEYAM